MTSVNVAWMFSISNLIYTAVVVGILVYGLVSQAQRQRKNLVVIGAALMVCTQLFRWLIPVVASRGMGPNDGYMLAMGIQSIISAGLSAAGLMLIALAALGPFGAERPSDSGIAPNAPGPYHRSANPYDHR